MNARRDPRLREGNEQTYYCPFVVDYQQTANLSSHGLERLELGSRSINVSADQSTALPSQHRRFIQTKSSKSHIGHAQQR